MLTARPCYFCGRGHNPVIVDEPAEVRFGRPVMPEGCYRLARCRGCGALYVDSDVSDAYLSGMYEAETVEGIADLRCGTTHDAIVETRLPEFERNWRLMQARRPARPGDRLLDVGCQTGEFGELVAKSGVIPNGVELSPEYADTARRRWGPASVVQPSMGPFADAEFAYITAFETLEHVVDPIGMLRTLRPWLAPDGLLAVSVPSAQYFRVKARLAGAGSVPHVHVYTPSRRAVGIALQRAGFAVRFLDASGWHGRLQPLNRAATALAAASRQRVLFAPSIIALASRS